MYYDSRYYDLHLRRFIQPDTLLPNVYDPQQLNRYSYANNNPLKYTDPSGHTPWLVALANPFVFIPAAFTFTVIYSTNKDVRNATNALITSALNKLTSQSTTTSKSPAHQKKTETKNSGGNSNGNTPANGKTNSLPQNSQQGGTSTQGNLQNTSKEIKNFNPNRNVKQDKKLNMNEIRKIEKEIGESIHGEKGKGASRYDLFKDDKGNIYQKPKNGKGEGEPLNINLNNL